MKKPTSTTRRVRSDAAQADPDPYKPARRPARAVGARSDAPRSAPRSGPRGAPRGDRPARSFDRSDRPARSFDRSDRPARSFDRSDRPVRSPRPPRDGDSAPRYGARPFGGGEDRGERGGFADRGDRASGFTVNLDSDVARVFRGDASVNKALRLVMQLMQVVQGPPPREGGRFGSGERTERPRSPGGYRGTAEARGFERKPRFEESSDDSEE